MCGIVYAQTSDAERTRQFIELQYLHQRGRGKTGFGIIECDTANVERTLTEEEMLQSLYNVDSKSILLHHRYPTSTSNTLKTTHPFRVKNSEYDLLVVHNGVIANPDEVLRELGIEKTSLASYEDGKYNDSEALAYDFLDSLTTGRRTLHSMGSIALIAYDKQNNCLWLYRNEKNPLVYYRDEDLVLFASEAPYYADITEDKLMRYNIESKIMGECRGLKSKAAPVVARPASTYYPSYYHGSTQPYEGTSMTINQCLRDYGRTCYHIECAKWTKKGKETLFTVEDVLEYAKHLTADDFITDTDLDLLEESIEILSDYLDNKEEEKENKEKYNQAMNTYLNLSQIEDVVHTRYFMGG